MSVTRTFEICAVTAPFPGVVQVLQNGFLLGLWDLVDLGKIGGTNIPAARTYLFGAWHPEYEHIIEMLPLDAQIVVLWTSSGGEVGFEPLEQGYLLRLLANKRIAKIWFGHRPLAVAFPEKGFYAPYPVAESLFHSRAIPQKQKILTLFCPATLKKNLFNQLVACTIFQQKHGGYRLVTNTPVPEVFKGKLVYQEVGWLPDPGYFAVLESSSVNLACSFAETLNYQSLMAAGCYTPSVGSSTIPWLPIQAQAPPNDPEAIAEVMWQVLGPGPADGETQREAAIEWGMQANLSVAQILVDKVLGRT